MNNWLDPFLKHAGHSQESLADELGVARATINRLAQDHSKLKRARAIELAEVLGVSADELMVGRLGGGSNAAPVSTGQRMRAIPDLAIHGGLGNGGLLDVAVDDAGRPTDPDQLNGFWEFPDYILRSLRNLSRIYAWQVRGDSMEPTLAGGSVVFVDTSQNTPPPEDIYAINYGDGLMVKRLKLVPRTEFIDVISDNERYGTDRLQREDVQIYGRVIGWFQWRG